MNTLGEFLRVSRKEKNISLDVLEDNIKVSKKILKQLEQDRLDPSFPTVYARGFILSYCRAVGINEKEALDLYERTYGVEQRQPVPFEQPEPEPEKTRTIPIVPVLVILLVIAAVVIFFAVSRKQKETAFAPPAALEKPEVTEPEPEAPSLPAEEQEETPVPVEEPSAVVPPEPEEPEPQPLALPEAETGEEAGPTPSLFEVTVTARSRTWLEVTINGGDPFELMLFPEDIVSWKAEEEILVKLGNAGGALFAVNDIPLQPFGQENQVVTVRFSGNTVSVNNGTPQPLARWRKTE